MKQWPDSSSEQEYCREEKNTRYNNLLQGFTDYDRVPSLVMEWINADKKRLEEEIKNQPGEDILESDSFDWSVIATSLPQDLKFEIIDFIPTFSWRRALNVRLSDRSSDDVAIDEDEIIRNIEEMQQVMKWEERRMKKCLFVRDIPMKTMHKMRVISKEYANRMKFKLMTLSTLEFTNGLSQNGLCYLASFLKAQQLYLNKKNENQDFLIYNEVPIIQDEMSESEEDLDDISNLSSLYKSHPLEGALFEYVEPDEHELPNDLVEFVGSNTIVTSVKTLGKPNIMALLFSTCTNLKQFVSDGKILVDHTLPKMEYWTNVFCEARTIQKKIEKICATAQNIKGIEIVFSCETSILPQDFLDNIKIDENMKLIIEGCVNKIIPAASGKAEREVSVRVIHLESEDEQYISKQIQLYGIPSMRNHYIQDALFSQRYFSFEKKKRIAEELFTKGDELFPLELIYFNEIGLDQDDSNILFAYTVYLSNQYQNGVLFNTKHFIEIDKIEKALEYGWKPNWDELLMLKPNFATSQIEKLFDLIRNDYQNDVNFFKYLRILFLKSKIGRTIDANNVVRAMSRYFSKNQFSENLPILLKHLFKPSKICVPKDFLPIFKCKTISIPSILLLMSSHVSFVSMLKIYPEEFWQSENGDTLLHLVLSLFSDSDNLLLMLDNVLRKYPELLNVTNNQNRTPLHLACYNGNGETIRLLSMFDVNIEQKDCSGKTPLDYISDESLKDYFE